MASRLRSGGVGLAGGKKKEEDAEKDKETPDVKQEETAEAQTTEAEAAALPQPEGDTTLDVTDETVNLTIPPVSPPRRSKQSSGQHSFQDMYTAFTPSSGHHMDAKVITKPKVPPRADEVYQIEIEDVRSALVWISLGMFLFGLFTSVSLLTGPIIAGTFGGITMLVTGVVALRLSVGSVLMFRATKRFQMMLSRNASRDDYV